MFRIPRFRNDKINHKELEISYFIEESTPELKMQISAETRQSIMLHSLKSNIMNVLASKS